MTVLKSNALRVMSFNVQLDVSVPERIDAVRAEVEQYEPDLLGLQEDSSDWNNAFSLNGYVPYVDPALKGRTECDGIYVKKGLHVLEYGFKKLADGKEQKVALTYEDVTADGSRYRLTEEELAALEITTEADLYERKSCTGYKGKVLNVACTCGHRMTYVLLKVGGDHVLYVNLHLQHRSQNADYGARYDAMMKIRNFARMKEFDMAEREIDRILKNYPCTKVIITGDFNDLVGSPIYQYACERYNDSRMIAVQIEGTDNTWNDLFSNSDQAKAVDTSLTPKSMSRLDFCFVSDGIIPELYQTGIPYAEAGGRLYYTSDHLAVIVDLRL